MSGQEQARCRALLASATGGNPQPCVRKRGHIYSDYGSNPKKLHVTSDGTAFLGGVKTPSRLPYAEQEHFSEADYQTWMRL